MTLFDYIGKLQRGIANLADELREQQATIDRMTPVYDYACRLAELWDTRKAKESEDIENQ